MSVAHRASREINFKAQLSVAGFSVSKVCITIIFASPILGQRWSWDFCSHRPAPSPQPVHTQHPYPHWAPTAFSLPEPRSGPHTAFSSFLISHFSCILSNPKRLQSHRAWQQELWRRSLNITYKKLRPKGSMEQSHVESERLNQVWISSHNYY